MGKKLMIFLFIIIMGGTLGIIALVADVTLKQYEDTKEWQTTVLSEELKDTPPFLARNYVKAEDKKASEVWQQVSDILDSSGQENGIPTEKLKEYRKVLKKAVKLQKQYGITSGEVATNNDRMRLYLNLEKAFLTAYETPDTERLKELTDHLYTMNLTSLGPADSSYFERLRTVAEDYGNLSVFLSEFLPRLGVINEKTLTVNTDVTIDIAEEVRREIERCSLGKFPFISSLYQMLDGNDWDVILRRNEVTRAYHTWKEAERQLSSITKSQYWPVSSIQTYQQALDLGLNVIINEREGYTIDPESPVAQMTHNGVPVTEGQYVRYGTSVEVTLAENYIEISKPEEPEAVEEKPEKPKKPKKDKDDDTEDDGWENWEDGDGEDTEEEEIPEDDSEEDNPDGSETSVIPEDTRWSGDW